MKKSESKIGLLKTIKEKLEMNNPKRYIDGYYQLSKKQKWLWVLGLFLMGVVFSIVRLLLNDKVSSFGVDLISCIIGSTLIEVASFALAFFFYRPYSFFNKKEERKILAKKTLVVLYQLWTVFLIVIMLAITFKIPFNNFISHF